MIPILSASQTQKVDQHTIQYEPISSERLMERASQAFVSQFAQIAPIGKKIIVFAGTGNNGGDALAISRILIQKGHQVSVFCIGDPSKGSDDFLINHDRLTKLTNIFQINKHDDFPEIDGSIIIEGIFGSGLSRPVEGLYGALIQHVNESTAPVYAIDIPSGLFADQPSDNGAIIKANVTITFQTPKLAFMQPDNFQYVGNWHVVDIGLDQDFINNQATDFFYTSPSDLEMPIRSKFDHKASVKRLMIIAGSQGKMGAAILCGRAALRSGSGLVFMHVPAIGMPLLQTTAPEAMVIPDDHQEMVTKILPRSDVKVVAMGPGLGTHQLTQAALADFLSRSTDPLILDADALNILADDEQLLELLPRDSILTPHPGEFRRLVGDWKNDFEKIELLQNFCTKHQVNVVLKGAHSAVCNTKAQVYFNCTGNPGMATPGSGDVLTGITAAIVSQIEDPFEALKTAVYLHGLAGDLAADKYGQISMNASDIINQIPVAFQSHHLRNHNPH